jgi:hypothetical protein
VVQKQQEQGPRGTRHGGDGGGAFRKTRYTEASEVGKPCRRFHEILGSRDLGGRRARRGQARIVSLWKLGERRYWISPQREGD